jgi:hypothetical protein
MRVVLALLVIATGLVSVSPAHAWYDRWGYWHPNHNRRYYAYQPPPPRYYRPPVYVAPRPYYRPPPRYYYRPY